MSEKNKVDAEALIASEYEKKFGQRPGPNEQMAIRLFAPRVSNGEPFVWIDDGNFRRLQLVKGCFFHNRKVNHENGHKVLKITDENENL